MTYSRALLSREYEIGAVGRILRSAAAGIGCFLVASGEAGIGKTALLNEAVDRARGEGFRILQARGSYSEGDRSFGLARRLFGSAPAQSDVDIQIASVLAALSSSTPEFQNNGGQGSSFIETSFADLDALNLLVSYLALEREPIVIAIDNLHWADRPTLRWLITLAERIESVPVAIFATVCGGIPGTDPALLDDLLFCCSHELRITRLGFAAATTVMEEQLGASPDRSFVTACMYATEGNPLLLNELARALAEHGVRPDARAADSLSGVVIDSLARSTHVRLRRISPVALSLFRAIAVLDGQATFDRIALITGTDLGTAAENCSAMTQMGLVTAAQLHVKVSQPLVRNAIMADHASTARQALHAQAAKLLYLDGEPENAIAEQLLLSSPLRETWVPTLLRSAAQTALVSGDPRAAILYLRRALAEPVDNDTRPVLLVEVANASTHTDIASAARSLAQAATLAPPAVLRDHLTPAAFNLLVLSGREDQAAELINSDLTHTSAQLNDSLTIRLALFAQGPSGGIRTMANSLDRLRALAPYNALEFGLAAMAEAVSDGSLTNVVSLAQRAAAYPISIPEDLMAHLAAIQVLCWAGNLMEAQDLCEAVVVTADRWQHRPLHALGLSVRSAIHRRLGSVSAAVDDARHGLDLLLACGIRRQAALIYVVLANLVLALTDSGFHNDALTALERSELNGNMPEGCGPAVLLLARGRLRCASDQTDAGIQDLIACGRQLTEQGITNPAIAPWRSEAAHSFVRAGQPHEAQRYADEEVTLARRWGEPGQIGAALRAQAIAYSGDASQLSIISDSIAHLRTAGVKLELARSLIDYGLMLVQSDERVRARQPLREAVRLAREIECPNLVEQSKSAYAKTGGRLRNNPINGISSLTKSERNVAYIAATGKTNREIAKLLFVQQRTIEIHLTNAYRKLGIDGRSQLRKVIRDEPRI